MSSRDLADGGRAARLEALSEQLGYVFGSPDLLEAALLHRSWCAENGGVPSNERLEFLGDAVLQLVITDRLFSAEPPLPEGVLAQRRAALVNTRTLAGAARRVDLGGVIRLGRGEASTGGADKDSILADATEAVLGAVYLDGGLDVATEVTTRWLSGDIERIEAGGDLGDAKSKLQELTAHGLEAVPHYEVWGSGPEHALDFRARVRLVPAEIDPADFDVAVATGAAATVWGEGLGRTKKDAEQAAATAALKRLVDEGKLNDEHA